MGYRMGIEYGRCRPDSRSEIVGMREWGQGSAQVQKNNLLRKLFVQFRPPGNYIFQGSTVSNLHF